MLSSFRENGIMERGRGKSLGGLVSILGPKKIYNVFS